MRRTRGEILRRFFRAAVAVFDFAEGDFAAEDFDDLLVVCVAGWEVVDFFGLSVCAGAAVLWSVCRPRAGEDAHNEPQAMPVTRIKTEVRE